MTRPRRHDDGVHPHAEEFARYLQLNPDVAALFSEQFRQRLTDGDVRPPRIVGAVPLPRVRLGNDSVDLVEYVRLLDAFQADHPDWVPPRLGIRGSAARLHPSGLPPDWAVPYLHLLLVEDPDDDR